MSKEQKKLITEIMNDDAKDGLYEQTAVEWLAKEIKTFEKDYGAIIHHKGELKKLLNQAKEIHKQQIIDAHIQGHLDGIKDSKWYELDTVVGTHEEPKTSEQYYNETFKN